MATKNPYENCDKARFHRLKVLESPFSTGSKLQIEQCQECGAVETFELDAKGEAADIRRYFLAHIRDFAQPLKADPDMFEVFMFCNPKLAKKLEEEAKQKAKDKDWQTEMSEGFRLSLKNALLDKELKYTDSRGVDRSFRENK